MGLYKNAVTDNKKFVFARNALTCTYPSAYIYTDAYTRARAHTHLIDTDPLSSRVGTRRENASSLEAYVELALRAHGCKIRGRPENANPANEPGENILNK